MNPAGYRDFCTAFFAATLADNVPDVDARLKGSAAVIYSGRHKRLPANWADQIVAFRQGHGRPPT